MPKINLDIVPREAFREFITTDKRWLTLVCHRRAGKTVAAVQRLIYCALTHKREGMDTAPLRYGYCAPTLNQSKSITWQYFVDFCSKIPNIDINQAELRITFPNRAQIRLFSGENYERMRGLYFDGIVCDEDDDIPIAAYKYVILPCLLDYRGWFLSCGTPKGRGTLYHNVERAKNDPSRFCLVLKANESGIISEDDLAEIRAEIGDDAYRQEMLCDFSVARAGAVYAQHIAKAREQGRVCDFEPSQSHLVYTTWDLGSPKNLVVNYWQKVDLTYRLIDCDHGLELTTAQRVAHMLDKGYNYAQHFLPHDGRARGADNMNFKDKLLQAGLRNVEVLDRLSHDAANRRIRAMIDIFPQIWFNKQLLAGDGGLLDALENYHFKEMKKDGHITSVPEHDWSSHFADSFGYFAEALLSGRMMDSLSKRGVGRAKASFGNSR
jgi:hypothetical protein